MMSAKLVKVLSEACTDSSPRAARTVVVNDVIKSEGGDIEEYPCPMTSRHLRLRVDEYDMYRMEEVLKQEIAEIDRRLDSCGYQNTAVVTEPVKPKPRRTTLSNDPSEVKLIQHKSDDQDEPVLFKKNVQTPKPRSRTMSKDPKEMFEIEKYAGVGNHDRDLLGVVPTTARTGNNSEAKPKTSTLTNDIGERRKWEKRVKPPTKSLQGSPSESTEKLFEDVFGKDFIATQRESQGPNPILGIENSDTNASSKSTVRRRRFFSTNHVEMRQIETAHDKGDYTNDEQPFYMMKSQPTTPMGRRKTLTNNVAELRRTQEKDGHLCEDEMAVGFKKEKPKPAVIPATISQSKHRPDVNGNAENEFTLMVPKSCPGTPLLNQKRFDFNPKSNSASNGLVKLMNARRQITLSNNPSEMQRIQYKYDLDQWDYENTSDYPRTIAKRDDTVVNARRKSVSCASNDANIRRVQDRTGRKENLAHIFGACELKQPAKRVDGKSFQADEKTINGYPNFGMGGGGAPIRDRESGKIVTGVGGKFHKDYFNLDSDPSHNGRLEQKKRDLEEIKRQIQDNQMRRKLEQYDSRASEDFVDKLQKLNFDGNQNGAKRQKNRNTSDVTRMKMDIRYPTESEAKEYYSHLSSQEQQKKQVMSQNTTRTLEPNNTSTDGFETTVDLLEKRRNSVKGRGSFKLRSSSGHKSSGKSDINSKYIRETSKLATPFAVED